MDVAQIQMIVMHVARSIWKLNIFGKKHKQNILLLSYVIKTWISSDFKDISIIFPNISLYFKNKGKDD